jgi:hypothetical protein
MAKKNKNQLKKQPEAKIILTIRFTSLDKETEKNI